MKRESELDRNTELYKSLEELAALWRLKWDPKQINHALSLLDKEEGEIDITEFINQDGTLNNEKLAALKEEIYLSYKVIHSSSEIIENSIVIVDSGKSEQENSEDISDNTVESLFYVASFLYDVETRDAALGDLEERFEKWCSELGLKKAKRRLAGDIFDSLKEVVEDTLRKRGVQAIKAAGLYKLLRYFWDLYLSLSN
jgi:hypothetical protein